MTRRALLLGHSATPCETAAARAMPQPARRPVSRLSQSAYAIRPGAVVVSCAERCSRVVGFTQTAYSSLGVPTSAEGVEREARMVIRQSRHADADAIALLAAQLGYPAPALEVALLHASIVQLPDHAVFVAEDEQRAVVGWLHVFIARRVFVASFAELGGIVVDDAHRRHGIGSALLAKAEDWALSSGCSLIRIRSNTQRLQADTFYRDCGLNPSKTQSVFEKALARERHA